MRKNIHGGDRYGKNIRLDYSANINPLGLPKHVKEQVAAKMEEYTHYPDPEYLEIRQLLEEKEDIWKEHILCGNGASELILAYCLSLKPKKVLLPIPSFAEYERSIRTAGGDILPFLLERQKGYQVTASILDSITEEMDLLLLGQPNNPSGQAVPLSLLRKILDRAEKVHCQVLLDECFLEFIPDYEAYEGSRLLNRYGNLTIVKAFTKTFAMAGFRFGYLMSTNERLLGRIQEFLPEWNVSYPAVVAAKAALETEEEEDYLEQSRQYIKKEREYLKEQLERMGFEVIPSQVNFLLFRETDFPQTKEKNYRKLLITTGILIRSCGNFTGLTNQDYRIAVRTREENEQLIEELGGIRARWQEI